MAKEKGLEYIETSAKLSHNIDEVHICWEFYLIIQKAFLQLTSSVHEKISKGIIEVKKVKMKF